MNKDLTNNTASEASTSANAPASGSPKSARRELLGSGVAAAATMAFGLLAVACSDDDKDKVDAVDDTDGGSGTKDGGSATRDGGNDTDAGTPAAEDADIASLNALLTAEYNAITAYGAGAGLIGAAPASDPLFTLAGPITDIAVDFRAHHILHAAALVEAIEELGGTPVVEADVAAAFVPPKGLTDNPTITNVLKFACSAERGAAVAYNQVLAGLEAAKYRFLATVIEGDESQHFIVLAALVLGLVKPEPAIAAATGDVVPEAFVTSYGGNKGLDNGFANYFA